MPSTRSSRTRSSSIAVKGTRWRGSTKLLEGPTAIIFSYEIPSAPAKVATKVAKEQEKFVIKGGYFDGKALDVKGVEASADAAGQGRAAGDFACDFAGAVPQNFLRLTTAGPQNFVYLLAARERAQGDGEG